MSTDELQRWQSVHDRAMKVARDAARKIALIKAAKRARLHKSHLRIVSGAWIGGVGLAALAREHRGTIAGGLVGSTATAGIAMFTCTHDTIERPAEAAVPPPVVRVQPSESPHLGTPAVRVAPLPTTTPTTQPPITVETPIPLPTEIGPTQPYVKAPKKPKVARSNAPTVPNAPRVTVPPNPGPPIDTVVTQ